MKREGRRRSEDKEEETNADEASLWVCPPKPRLPRVLGLQLVGRLDLLELGHGPHRGRVLAARSLGVAEGAVERGHGRRGVAVEGGGVGRNGGQLRRALAAANVVGALRVVAGVGGRLLRRRAGELRLGRGVGRGWRQRVHGRVALGGGRGLAALALALAVVMLELRMLLLLLRLVLRRVEPRRAGARQVGLVVRPHGVLDAGMGIVGVVHGDVAAGVARERRGDGVDAAGAVVGAGLQRVRELRRELERMRALALRLAVEREMLLLLLVVMVVLVLELVVAVGRRRTAGRRRRGSNGRHGRGRGVAGSRDGQRRRIVSRWLAVGVASLRVSLRVGEPLRIVHGGLAGQKGPRPRRGVSAGCG